jgi:hypothetical protein
MPSVAEVEAVTCCTVRWPATCVPSQRFRQGPHKKFVYINNHLHPKVATQFVVHVPDSARCVGGARVPRIPPPWLIGVHRIVARTVPADAVRRCCLGLGAWWPQVWARRRRYGRCVASRRTSRSGGWSSWTRPTRSAGTATCRTTASGGRGGCRWGVSVDSQASASCTGKGLGKQASIRFRKMSRNHPVMPVEDADVGVVAASWCAQ